MRCPAWFGSTGDRERTALGPTGRTPPLQGARMSNPPDPNQTVDLPTVARLMALREQFKAAWQEALQGGAQPQIASYLALAPEPERLVLHRELSQIEQTYQQRLRGPNGAPEADEKTVPVEPI